MTDAITNGYELTSYISYSRIDISGFFIEMKSVPVETAMHVANHVERDVCI